MGIILCHQARLLRPEARDAMISLIAIAAATSVFYAWLWWQLTLLRRTSRLHGPQTSGGLDHLVTVVIAARDEASTIETTLRGLLAQEGIERIILVDDHSSDSTMSIACNVAREDSRLYVCQAPPLPAGWVGKNHALHYGAQSATSTFILFMDADVILLPGTVAMAVRMMAADRLDHLSGYFGIRCDTIAEEMCAPVYSAGAALTLFRAARTQGAATGAFNLIRTEFYRHIGGHEQIKGTIVDDVFLARLAKAAGGRSGFIDLADRVQVRLFQGFGGFMSAIARSALAYMEGDWLSLMLAGTGLCFLGAVSLLLPVIGVTQLVTGGFRTGGSLVAILGCLAYGLGMACIFLLRRYHTGRMVWGLAYPLVIILLGAATFQAGLMGLFRRQVHWRGRLYRAA